MGLFAQEGYRSPTVTAVANTKSFIVDDMAKFMGGKGFSMDKGYGKIKGKTFRIAHMGDMQPVDPRRSPVRPGRISGNRLAVAIRRQSDSQR